MRTHEKRARRALVAVAGFVMILICLPLSAIGQGTGGALATNTRTVPSGAKMKFKGVVIRRDADTFVIRDRSRADYEVLMTDDTSIKTYGGFLHGGKKYAVTDVLTGLIVEVEGRGDQDGRLVAQKIRFNESDMRAAITTDTRVGPVEANQLRLSGQIDELSAIAAEARSEAATAQATANQANERISSLDDYDVQDSVVVNFRVNSAVLSPEAKSQLDDLASRISTAKAFIIEVAGHADATGSAGKNFQLSQRRAEAVIQYLAVNHKIPQRRFITPMGYGATEAVSDNTTATGRAQNRRVEVKVLTSKGMARPNSITSTQNQ